MAGSAALRLIVRRGVVVIPAEAGARHLFQRQGGFGANCVFRWVMKELTRVEIPRRADTSAMTLAGSNSHPLNIRFSSPRATDGAASHSERSAQPSPML